MLESIKQSVDYIKNIMKNDVEVGIILGSGLGGLVDNLTVEHEIPYSKIPNFPISTVEGHKGSLLIGKLGGKSVVVMQGRFHYYEGYTAQEVTFPVRVMKFLGIKYLFVSNAAGGMNPNFKVGDIMFINDHVNLIPNPLIGKNHEELGPRFPDMSETYAKTLLTLGKTAAAELDIEVKEGVYVATTGPTFETPAEYTYFRVIGGDAVGMSTAPEVIVAHHMGIPCFGMSVITDMAVTGTVVPVSHEEVLEAAQKTGALMTKIVQRMLEKL